MIFKVYMQIHFTNPKGIYFHCTDFIRLGFHLVGHDNNYKLEVEFE